MTGCYGKGKELEDIQMPIIERKETFNTTLYALPLRKTVKTYDPSHYVLLILSVCALQGA